MEGSELLISGKLMEYIAADRPILCLGNPYGDAAELIKDFEDCAVFDRGNSELIVNFLNHLFQKWINKQQTSAKNKDIQFYSRYETTRKLSVLINTKL